jgi:hypothetical protein
VGCAVFWEMAGDNFFEVREIVHEKLRGDKQH